MSKHQILGQHTTNLEERLFRKDFLGTIWKLDFHLLGPVFEGSSLLPKLPESLFPINPLRVHVLSKVVDKAKKRVRCVCGGRHGPLLELLNPSSQGPLAKLITDHTPELNGWLVVLPLRGLKLKATSACRFTQDSHVVEVFLEGRTTDLEVIHAGTAKLLSPGVPKAPKLLSYIPLHFCWRRRRTEGHPRPLIQSRAAADD